MTFRFSSFLVFVTLGAHSVQAERLETFDSLENTISHGWSVFSPTQDFTANVTSTSQANGDSGPGEAVITVVPGVFTQGAYFADTNLGRRFDFNDSFSFSGSINIEDFGTDDTMQVVVGFFNSQAVRNSARHYAFVGFSVGIGSGAQPSIGIAHNLDGGGGAGGIYVPFADDGPTTIALKYEPNGDFGSIGKTTLQYGARQTAINVTIFDTMDTSSFDAFGVFAYRSVFAGTSNVTVVVDDLRYTTFVPEPASSPSLAIAAMYGLVSLRFRLLHRRDRHSSCNTGPANAVRSIRCSPEIIL